MYRHYVLKRALYGIMMYVVMVFTFSIIFNNVADRTMRDQIEEQVTQEIRKYRNLNEEQIKTLQAERRAAKIKQYHLDQPLASRVFFRAINTLTFNFGNSTSIKSADGTRKVLGILMERLPNTLILFTTEVLLVIVIGVPMGLWGARRPNGPLDRSISTLTMVSNGLPSWWLGMIMIMVFSYAVKIFPSSGIHGNPIPPGLWGVGDFLWHLALPLFTLVILSVWGTAYLTRNIVLGNLQEDFVMAARARGIPERRVLLGHTLRTSMPAIITIAVLNLFASISGNIVFEGIFGWPGLGQLYFVAIQQADVPVLMANLSLQALINMVGFIMLDIIYGWLDPRIKVGGKA